MQKTISFIIPAYNESKHIASCISSIMLACKDNDLEPQIIVVNNGSTDDTSVIASKFPIDLYTINRSSVSYARNFGASKARYPILAFIDGDVEITNEWATYINAQYEQFIASPMFITGSQCQVPGNGTWIEQYWFKNIKDQLLGGANIITSKTAFDFVGGFNESLKTGEDYDFCIRCINSNINYSTNSRLIAIHLGFPHTLQEFMRREYWHGEGDFKSLYRFLKSSVAIIAILYLILFVTALALALSGMWLYALSCFMVLFIINLLITFKRFRHYNSKIIVVNSYLNFLYFIARIGSLFRAIKNRGRAY